MCTTSRRIKNLFYLETEENLEIGNVYYLWLFPRNRSKGIRNIETGGAGQNRDFIVHQNSILLPVAAVNFETCRYQRRPVFAHKRNASFRSYWFQIRPIYALCIRFPPCPFRPVDSAALLFFFCRFDSSSIRLLFFLSSDSSFHRVQLGFFKRTAVRR